MSLHESTPHSGHVDSPTSPEPRDVLTRPLLRRLNSLARLGAADADLIRAAVRRARTMQAHTLLYPGKFSRAVGQDVPPGLIVRGWAVRTALIGGESRIIDVLAPGDFIGLGSAPIDSLAVESLSTVTIADLSHAVAALKQHPGQHAGLAAAVQAAADAEAGRLLDRLVAISHLTAVERFCRWLLEFHSRLLEVDAATDASFSAPITQAVIAELLGISPVHVNRVVKQLRGEGLLSFNQGRIRLLDLPRLRELAALPAKS